MIRSVVVIRSTCERNKVKAKISDADEELWNFASEKRFWHKKMMRKEKAFPFLTLAQKIFAV